MPDTHFWTQISWENTEGESGRENKKMKEETNNGKINILIVCHKGSYPRTQIAMYRQVSYVLLPFIFSFANKWRVRYVRLPKGNHSVFVIWQP